MEGVEEEVREVERDVEVEKSNIRAMKVVCSLQIKMVNAKRKVCLYIHTLVLSQERCQ